jgi:hypothetical protein
MQPLVEVHDALRADPGNRQIAQLTSPAPRTVTIKTPAVTAPTAATDPVMPFKIAGAEYVVINGSDLLGEASTAAASLRLTLAVNGAQVEGPRLAVVGVEATTAPSPTPTESSSPGSSDEPTDGATPADDGSGLPAWLWAVLGAVALAVVGGAVAVSRRGAERG